MTLIGRRRFLQRVAAGGAVLAMPAVLAACADPRDADRLAFLNWTDYIDDELLATFTARSGIVVTYETYSSNDNLARRLEQAQRARRGGRSGTSFDLMVPSDNFVTRFRNGEQLTELDRSAISNLGNLGETFADASYDPGNRFSVPWATGTTGIGYDTTVFPEPPGYEVFLDPAHLGRMSILDEVRDAMGLALFSLGEDPNTTSEETIEAAADQLIAMKPQLSGFDSAGYLDGLASGDLVAAQAYSSDLLQARQSNPDLAFVLPPAGALRWVDAMVVPVDAPRPDNAHRFIDFYLEPEIAAANSIAIRADTGNAAAVELLPAEILDDPVIFPDPATADLLVFTEELGPVEELYAEAFDRVKEA